MKTTTFAELGLSPSALQAVDEAGYEAPTPIQAEAIPIMLAGEDLMAQAQTGTGKTAAFALPLVQLLDPDQISPQALVVCPTRELAVQVAEAIYGLGRVRGLRVLPVYGGQPIDRQLRGLRNGVQIVVGTPGRLLDHLRRGTLDLTRVSTVILDEADEMLDMGFVEEIEEILQQLPEERQIALFSATIPAPIARLAGKYLRNPRQVRIASEPATTPHIRQSYYEVLPAHKLDALTRILDMETPGPTIIFCRTKREVDELGEHLRGRGYLAEGLHGDMSQGERDRAMGRFRQGLTDLLVATDVAARGLDIETVTHVINYDIPWDADSYTHRIGRTGRAGREGDAITLVSPRERFQLKVIERNTGVRIKPVRLPSAADIMARRRELFKESIVRTLDEGDLGEFLITLDELAEEHDPHEVGAAALKLLWGQQQPSVTEEDVAPWEGERAEPGMARLFLTIGRRAGLRPTDLVGAIANEAGIPGREIGAIDILDDHAFVEVPKESAERVVRALLRTTLRGQRVRVEAELPAREASFRPEPSRPKKHAAEERAAKAGKPVSEKRADLEKPRKAASEKRAELEKPRKTASEKRPDLEKPRKPATEKRSAFGKSSKQAAEAWVAPHQRRGKHASRPDKGHGRSRS